MDQDEALHLTNYISKCQYPTGLTKNQKRRLRDQTKPFFVVDDILYHTGKAGKRQKVVIGDVEKIKIIESGHLDVTNGCHLGQSVTIKNVTDNFWWRSVSVDIRKFCKLCERCKRSNPTPIESTELKFEKDLFHCWGIDFHGPLKETSNGKRYVIVATEYLTRWVELAALPDKSVKSVHSFLMGIVYRYGASQMLLQHQERDLVQQLFDSMDTAYHPICDGVTEVFNQTLVAQLKKMLDSEIGDWEIYLQPIAFAYRTMPQESGRSPFELLYGQTVLLPVDLQPQDDDEVSWERGVTDVVTRTQRTTNFSSHTNAYTIETNDVVSNKMETIDVESNNQETKRDVSNIMETKDVVSNMMETKDVVANKMETINVELNTPETKSVVSNFMEAKDVLNMIETIDVEANTLETKQVVSNEMETEDVRSFRLTTKDVETNTMKTNDLETKHMESNLMESNGVESNKDADGDVRSDIM